MRPLSPSFQKIAEHHSGSHCSNSRLVKPVKQHAPRLALAAIRVLLRSCDNCTRYHSVPYGYSVFPWRGRTASRAHHPELPDADFWRSVVVPCGRNVCVVSLPKCLLSLLRGRSLPPKRLSAGALNMSPSTATKRRASRGKGIAHITSPKPQIVTLIHQSAADGTARSR